MGDVDLRPLSRVLPDRPVTDLDAYEAAGGGLGLAAAAETSPTGIIDVIERSGLRGRGGAGFPTGTKWRSVASGGAEAGTRFVVVNGAEGEPGTFKDRPLLRRDPYRVLEGALIAAVAIDASRVYVALKASFRAEVAAVTRAAAELQEAEWAPSIAIELVEGPEEYLFGEEKGLLEVIEGREPLPRNLPPFLHGLFAPQPSIGWEASGRTGTSSAPAASNPTLVNNVETFANVPRILTEGPDWFRSLGTDESPGSVLCTVSGDTIRAGVVEVAMGTPLATVLEGVGGGVGSGRRIKAVLSGVSNPVLTGEHLDTPLTYEHFAAIGSGLGAAGFLVFDDSRDMTGVAREVSRFLAVESCGQCPPCKLGSEAVTERLDTLLADGGTHEDLDGLRAQLEKVTDANRCYLGRQEQLVVSSLLEAFPEDLALNLTGVQTQPAPPITKIVDIDDGVAVLDERQALKQPDWSYEGGLG